MTSHILPGLALDIDETLSLTGAAIIMGLQKNFGNPENLTAQEIMNKYGHTSKIPYYQTKEIHAWKVAVVETEELYEDVPLIENANHIVEKIDKIIPIACYLTARPASTIGATKRWLKKYNFPNREVICKPSDVPYENGNIWKAGELLSRYPQILGIVDDNPALIQALSEEYKGTIFLYDHLEYDIETPINVIPCKNWDAVYDKIQKEAHLFMRF